MLGVLFLTLLVSRACGSDGSDGRLPYAYLEVEQGSASIIYAQVSLFGGMLPSGSPTGPSLRVVLADGVWGMGCRDFLPPSMSSTGPFALLATRGNCSFAVKALAAQKAGASMLLIYDGLGGKYYDSVAAGGPLSAGACDVQCDESSSNVAALDVTLTSVLAGFPATCGSRCASGLCALTPPAKDADLSASRKACCVPNDYLFLGGGLGSDSVVIPVLWVSAGDGAALAKMSAPSSSLLTPSSSPLGPRVRAAMRQTAQWDSAGLILWILGCLGALAASFTASHAERAIFVALRKPSGSGSQSPQSRALTSFLPPAEAIPELTWRSAAAIIVFASAFLFFLYGLILLKIRIVFLILFIFAFGASSAATALVIGPLLSMLAPWMRTRTMPLPRILWGCLTYCLERDVSGGIPLDAVLATGASSACVIAWLVFRHAPGAWAAQDTFALLVATLSCSQIRLPTMRSAALLLATLFVYDIFMVFGTPFLLGGESVMIEVATAGAPAAVPSGVSPTPACYCRTHPEDYAVCSPAELMPILLAWPRADWRGGFAMLGLGDIVVPALALAVALRFDYAQSRRERIENDRASDAETPEGRGDAIEATENDHDGDNDDAANSLMSIPTPSTITSTALRGGSSGIGVDVNNSTMTISFGPQEAWIPTCLSDFAALPLRKRGGPLYWQLGAVGYGVGLAIALLAVNVFHVGQPALLYLVPCVLLPMLSVAQVRGELGALWRGRGLEEPVSETSTAGG